MHWFTSDFHLGHKNIMKYCNRQFNTVHHMNKTIIDNVNDLVKRDDHLYFLGDFAFHKSIEDIDYLRSLFQCENFYFILGNHDKIIRRVYNDFEPHNFVYVKDYDELKINGQLIVLCHYSMKVWNKSHVGSYHLYGHSHGSLPDNPNSRSIDVGIDTELFGHKRYTPYSLTEIHRIMEHHKTFTPIDHHER